MRTVGASPDPAPGSRPAALDGQSAVARLIGDGGFEPLDLGGIDDSQFQEPGSAL
jgi:hypothetical protein